MAIGCKLQIKPCHFGHYETDKFTGGMDVKKLIWASGRIGNCEKGMSW